MCDADEAQLLAALVGTAPARALSDRPLAELLEEPPDRLRALGISARALRTILAGAELARRHQPRAPGRSPITGPRDALAHMQALRHLPQEVLAVLLLDSRLCPMGDACVIARGSVGRVGATAREVFGPALGAHASALVIAHNHPSGAAEPSADDAEFTRVMVEAGRVLEVEVVDHLVLARRAYFSFREAGML